MFCASCGAKQDDAARFCMACGAKVKTSADQRAVEIEVIPQQNVVDRAKDSRPSTQRPAQKSSGILNVILGAVVIAAIGCTALIYMHQRSEPATQKEAPATPNAAPVTNQFSVVGAQPATPIEAAWEPYIKYAPCLASNGELMQTFINNGVLPTAQNAASALAACK